MQILSHPGKISLSSFSQHPGIQSESSLLLWQGPSTSIIRNVLCSIGCFFIISRGFFENMMIVLRRSTDISGRSSKMLLRSISTVAIRCVGLPASGVRTVERSASYASLARAVVSVHRVMPSAVRNGASGCGRSFFWMSPIARLSLLFLRCCGFSSASSESSSMTSVSVRCGYL